MVLELDFSILTCDTLIVHYTITFIHLLPCAMKYHSLHVHSFKHMPILLKQLPFNGVLIFDERMLVRKPW